jgi:hypothetical protein
MMGQMPTQNAQGQGSQQGGPGVVSNTDEMLGGIAEALGQIPGGESLMQRMAKIREEYRRIMEEAMKMGGGGGGANMKQQASAGGMAERSAIPDRSMGTPQSPAGVY